MQELMKNGIEMSSRDLAELTGKEHKNVMADIRDEIEKLKKEGEINELIFQLVEYLDAKGEKRPQFVFGKEGAMQIAMRYSAVIRRKVILKLEELENKTKLPTNYLESLKQLVISEERRIEAERKNAILMHINKNYTMTEIAKELGMKSAIELNMALNDKKIQYKINGTWVLYSKYSNLGYEDIKQDILDNGKVVYHRKITQLGREFILNLFSISCKE